MPNNPITGETRDIDNELDVMEDDPTEELEAVTDPGAEGFLDGLDVVLTDEWP